MNGRGSKGMIRDAGEIGEGGLSRFKGPITLDGVIYEGRACVVYCEALGGTVVVLGMNDSVAMAACEYLSGISMSFDGVKDAIIGSPQRALRHLP